MKLFILVLTLFFSISVFPKSSEDYKVPFVYSKVKNLEGIWFPIEAETLNCSDDDNDVIFVVKKGNYMISYDIVKLDNYPHFIDQWWMLLKSSDTFPKAEDNAMAKLLGILSPIEVSLKIDESEEYFYYINKDASIRVLFQRFKNNLVLAYETSLIDWSSLLTDNCKLSSSEQTRKEFRGFLQLD